MNFLFSIAVWGDDYVERFLRFSLPSQLAEGNLQGFPWLSNSKYQIITSVRDAEKIMSSAGYGFLSTIMDTEILIIDEFIDEKIKLSSNSPDKYFIVSKCQMEAIRRSRGFDGIFFGYADAIWSMGSLQNAARRLSEGYDAVVCPGPPVAVKAFSEKVRTSNRLWRNASDIETLSLPSRDLVSLALRYLHPMAKINRWRSKVFTGCPAYLIWDVPKQGILMRWFHLHPVVIRTLGDNLNFFRKFDVSIDEEYMPLLFSSRERIYFPTDSDEISFCSLMPVSQPAVTIRPPQRPSVPLLARWAEDRAALLQRQFFDVAFRWHFADIDLRRWEGAERESENIASELRIRLSTPDSVLALEDPLTYQARKRRQQRLRNWLRPEFTLPWDPTAISRAALAYRPRRNDQPRSWSRPMFTLPRWLRLKFIPPWRSWSRSMFTLPRWPRLKFIPPWGITNISRAALAYRPRRNDQRRSWSRSMFILPRWPRLKFIPPWRSWSRPMFTLPRWPRLKFVQPWGIMDISNNVLVRLIVTKVLYFLYSICRPVITYMPVLRRPMKTPGFRRFVRWVRHKIMASGSSRAYRQFMVALAYPISIMVAELFRRLYRRVLATRSSRAGAGDGWK